MIDSGRTCLARDASPQAWLHEMRNVVGQVSLATTLGRRLLGAQDPTSALRKIEEAESALERCRALLAEMPGNETSH